MNGQSKEWVKQQLGQGCYSLYDMKLSDAGEILSPEGSFLKWAIRDGRFSDPWSYSVTIAMSLSALLKRPAEGIAEELADYLSKRAPSSWTFNSLNGYINAYFQPMCLSDFINGKEPFNWSVLKSLKNGNYAKYRLEVILRALEARGVGASSDSHLKTTLKEHPFGRLFDYPERSPEKGGLSSTVWEKWLDDVVQMTRQGLLRDLDLETEEILYAFIKACLN